MSGTLLDLRYALRLLRTSPGFSLLVVLTLGLGIGANTSLYSVVQAVWQRALPSGNADRLVAVWLGSGPNGRVIPSVYDFEQWQEHSDIFEGLASIATASSRVSIDGESHDVNVGRVQGGLFDLLDERPLLGRLLSHADEAPGASAVAVITQRFFHQRLGGDPLAIGRPIQVGSGASVESPLVVGVLPERFSRMIPSGIVMPAARSQVADPRARRPVRVVGLLRPELTVSQAHAMLEARPTASAAWRPQVVSLRDSIVGAEVGRVLYLLFGAVGLLLFIACANVANLLLARLADREREIAVRAAVGAGRWQLARQLLVESLLLAVLGAAVGLLLARVTRPLLISLMPARTPGLDTIAIDARVLGFTILATAVTAVVAGLWPVLRMSQARADQVMAGRTGAAVTRAGASRALLAIEVALALAVIVAAGTLVRSFVNLVHVDPGFAPENVIVFRTAPAPAPPLDRARIGRFGWNPAQLDQGRRVLEDLRRLPTVAAAGGVTSLPMGPGGSTYTIRFEGREIQEGEDRWVGFQRATPGYFEAMGIPLRGGRSFTDDDRDGAPGVVIVNEAAARRFWPGQHPIGTRVFLGSQDPLTVIGVVGDVRQRALATEPAPEVYRSWLQEPDGLQYVVRTSDSGMLGALSRPGATAGGVPVLDVRTLDDHVMGTVREPRARMLLFIILGAVVLLLTVVGVAGLTAHLVSRRTREAGIRLALGARPREIVTLMMGHTALPLVAGLAAGCFAAWWTGRFLESFLFEVQARDPLTFVLGTMVLAIAALGAGWLPARRAAHLDPAITLRHE